MSSVSVLILGSNGQLGRDLVEVLTDMDGVEVIPFTRQQFEAGRDPVSKLPKADYVINTIAFHNVDLAEERVSYAFEINSSFVHQLAVWVRNYRGVLIHISTDYIFDGTRRTPYPEEAAPNPLNIYGISKLAGELGVRNYLDRYFIFRVSSLFGVGGVRDRRNFVETMLRLGEQRRKLRVIEDQWMVPTHTLDVARGIGFFIENRIDEYGVYHLVPNGTTNWYQFAVEIFRQAGVNLEVEPIKWYEYPTKARRPLYSVLDNRKVGKFFKLPHWKEGLQEYLWRREQLLTS